MAFKYCNWQQLVWGVMLGGRFAVHWSPLGLDDRWWIIFTCKGESGYVGEVLPKNDIYDCNESVREVDAENRDRWKQLMYSMNPWSDQQELCLKLTIPPWVKPKTSIRAGCSKQSDWIRVASGQAHIYIRRWWRFVLRITLVSVLSWPSHLQNSSLTSGLTAEHMLPDNRAKE